MGCANRRIQGRGREALAQKTIRAFGAVQLLFNNAGAVTPRDLLGPGWECSLSEWEKLRRDQSVGCNPWMPCVCAHHACPGYRMPSCQHGIVRRAGRGRRHGRSTKSPTRSGEPFRTSCIINLAHCHAKLQSPFVPQSVQSRVVDSAVEAMPTTLARKKSRGSKHTAGMFRTDLTRPRRKLRLCCNSGIQVLILTHPESRDKVRIRMEAILQDRNPTVL